MGRRRQKAELGSKSRRARPKTAYHAHVQTAETVLEKLRPCRVKHWRRSLQGRFSHSVDDFNNRHRFRISRIVVINPVNDAVYFHTDNFLCSINISTAAIFVVRLHLIQLSPLGEKYPFASM